MSSRPPPATFKTSDDDVFAMTGKGNRQLKSSSGTALSSLELETLVLVDGISTVKQILERLPGQTRSALVETLGALRSEGLIVSTNEVDSEDGESGFSTISVPAGFFSSITEAASAEAAGGAALLKKKGFYVRIARRPAEERKHKDDRKFTLLVVDDDPDLQKLLGMYLRLEGFAVRPATNRDAILIGLRTAPQPDLVLLDVQMPDANGFDILAKLRLHPALKNIPVIMLTGETTRESVLKGLRGGADGYVTKPFEPENVVKAIKAVLGLNPPPEAKKK